MPARDFLLLACLVAVASCAAGPTVRSDVETFHRLTASDLTRTIAVAPSDMSKVGSLEFGAYATLVERGLADQGFKVVSLAQEPELVAFFDYAISEGRDQVFSYVLPQYGQTGIASSHTVGSVQSFGSGATYGGNTTYTPSYGITGYTSHVGTRRVFGRVAFLHIVDLASDGEPMLLYQSAVGSLGSLGSLAAVMDAMVEALFTDFLATGARTVTPGGRM